MNTVNNNCYKDFADPNNSPSGWILFFQLNGLTATSGAMPIIGAVVGHAYFFLHRREKKDVPFNMDIGNEKLVRECFPEHSLIGTARM